MTKNVEAVTVRASGRDYGLWENVEVTAALNETTRQFTLVSAEPPGAFDLPPGTAVQISANGDVLLTGYINKYKPRGNKTSHKVTVAGRGKAQDLVDCACIHDTHEWTGQKPDAILGSLDHFGVGVTARVALNAIDWRTAHGEKVFQAGERMLRDQGVSMMETPHGSVDLTNASVAKRAAGELAEGVNIEDYDGNLSDDGLHSEVHVKGQSRHGTGASSLRIAQQATNPDVQRYRPHVIVHETDSSIGRAQNRAQQEVERAAGASIKCRITTQGWRDDAGVLWAPNMLVFVNSPVLLHIVQDMLIEKVHFRQDNGTGTGSLAELMLVDPRTYKGKAGKKSKSDKAWGFRHSTGKQSGAAQ